MLYIFAAFLIATGIKMLVVASESRPDMAKNPACASRAHMRVTNELHGAEFFVRVPDAETRQAGHAPPRRCSWRWW